MTAITEQEFVDRRGQVPPLMSRPLRQDDKFIYIMLHPFTGAMKVGTSVDPYRRAKEVTLFNNELGRVEVLAYTYGNAGEERTMHHYLANLNCQAPSCMWSGTTEWFLPGGVLINIAHTWGLPTIGEWWWR